MFSSYIISYEKKDIYHVISLFEVLLDKMKRDVRCPRICFSPSPENDSDQILSNKFVQLIAVACMGYVRYKDILGRQNLSVWCIFATCNVVLEAIS